MGIQTLYVVYAFSLERHYSIRVTPYKVEFSILTSGALDGTQEWIADKVSRDCCSNSIKATKWSQTLKVQIELFRGNLRLRIATIYSL